MPEKKLKIETTSRGIKGKTQAAPGICWAPRQVPVCHRVEQVGRVEHGQPRGRVIVTGRQPRPAWPCGTGQQPHSSAESGCAPFHVSALAPHELQATRMGSGTNPGSMRKPSGGE